ncbi:MAG: hypothetical protein ACX98W_01510 [bacterium]
MADRVLVKGYPESATSGCAAGTEIADVYFSVDVETDGPVPGSYSMLSFALVPVGRMDGDCYTPPASYGDNFHVELTPISEQFEQAALAVDGLDRERLRAEGKSPAVAMREAADWLRARCAGGEPVLVAYPLGFDWSWIH